MSTAAPSDAVRIVLADDHLIVRAGPEALLDGTRDLRLARPDRRFP